MTGQAVARKGDANLLGVQTARLLREFVREQYAQSNLKRLNDIGSGVTRFQVPVVLPGSKDNAPRVELVDVEAPAQVQAFALKTLVDVAIPKQLGLVDADDKTTGVLVLPALDRAEPEEAEYEIVEEEIGPHNEAQLEDRDRAPAPREETIRPEFVAHVLARRKNGQNGKHQKRTRNHG